ncbi:MAG TPA: hypothetical protein VFN91_10195, partial [Myxococcaceae bacterium]|nr:hypothetical protein [Myxococcaceae bacterium]
MKQVCIRESHDGVEGPTLQGDHMHRLILLSVAASLSFLAVAARTEKSRVADNFSDREIFEGVVFGVGPVANLVPEARDQLRPEIYARSAADLASMTAVRTTLLASIDRAQPDLIGEFARAARSGDPAAIRSMLERATDAVNDAASEMQEGGVDGQMFANLPWPGDTKSRPGPRPVPKVSPAEPQLLANLPWPGDTKSRPGPRPVP